VDTERFCGLRKGDVTVIARVSRMMRVPTLVLPILALSACSDTTAPAAPDTRFTAVAAGDQFTCGLVRDGRVFCWGFGESGQLGDSTLEARALPGPVAGSARYTQLTARGASACALAADGTAWCWGANASGQLGFATEPCHPVLLAVACAAVPGLVEGVTGITALSAPGISTCGVAGEVVWCWGNDLTQHVLVDPLVRIVDTASYAEVAVGGYHACGLTRARALRCWGSSGWGQLGVEDRANWVSAPTPAATGRGWAAVAAAANHTCAVDTAGSGFCWGTGYYGLLGLGDSTFVRLPKAVADTLRFRAINTGANHTCAVGVAGDVYCWGRNDYGQLGVPGSPLCRVTPSPVPCAERPIRLPFTPPDVVAISVGAWHTCAITESGELWCWGRGTSGQLGNGAAENSSTPVLVVVTADQR